jgi:hypothetical protein
MVKVSLWIERDDGIKQKYEKLSNELRAKMTANR